MGKIYPGDAKGYYYTDDKGLRAACVKAPGRDAEFIHSREYIKAPNITAKTDNHLQADITMPSEPVLLPGGAWVEQVPKKERYEESQEYRNALDFRGFIKKINGKHSSPDAFAVESLTNLAPIRYWSVTHTDYVDGPARVMGAPTQLQEDIEECRRYLKMHWNERGRKCGLSGLGKEVLLRKANIKKLLAKPEVLARLLDVHRLFLWDSNGTGNFVDCRLGMLSCYGYK